MVCNWRILISGFQQSRSGATGFETLWLAMRGIESPETIVVPCIWRDDFLGLADRIHRCSQPSLSRKPDIRVFAYSWGVGHGAMRFAKALRNRGLQVSHAVFSDPVYHSWRRPWAALFGRLIMPQIVVPDNVIAVDWFRQRNNRPMGHDLCRHDSDGWGPGTGINDPVELDRTHEWMDDAPEFHAKSLEVAKGGLAC